MQKKTILLLPIIWMLNFCGRNMVSFPEFKQQFVTGYTQLPIPEMAYDYHDYFTAIPSIDKVLKQRLFFERQKMLLTDINQSLLNTTEKADAAHIAYEIDFNLFRITLEERWIKAGRKIPTGGLFALPDHQLWYQYFIKKFTSTEITPEEVFALGKSEVKRIKKEIKRIQLLSGFIDSVSFYRHLKNDTFYLTSKKAIIDSFTLIDQRVRNYLYSFVTADQLPEVYAMEWPEANAQTPPGMYLNHEYTAYGKDVFQFNFFNKRYNKRAMEWLYMHEAIPGHHLQASMRSRLTPDSLQELFIYPGNFEGWACYVEYFGKDLGLYTNIYSELGKWEWDLVRSARLVLDAGIHYYGWSRAKALQYWKETIPEQDEIAEREVTRVTNWTAQALSYKVGAYYIFRMKENWLHQYPQKSAKDFHDAFLHSGMRPLAVLEKLILL